MATTPVISAPEELQIESRTQSPEAIQEALAGDNYAVTATAEIKQSQVKLDADTTVESAPPPAAGDTGAKPAEQPGRTEVAEGQPAEAATTDAGGADEPDLTNIPNQDGQGRKLSGAQRQKLARERWEAERAELMARIEKLEKGSAAAPPPPAQVASPPPAATAGQDPDETPLPRPDPEDEEKYPDGRFDPKYEEDLVDWKLSERDRLGRLKAKKDQAQQVEARNKAKFEQRMAEARTQFSDFDEVMKRADQVKASFPMIAAIQDSERSPMVTYYLIAHPEEAERITAATTVTESDTRASAARKQALAYEEISKIEALLAGQKPGDAQPATTKQSVPAQAAGGKPTSSVPAKPAPVEPISGRGVSSTKRLSDLSQDELRRIAGSPEYDRLYEQEFGRKPY